MILTAEAPGDWVDLPLIVQWKENVSPIVDVGSDVSGPFQTSGLVRAVCRATRETGFHLRDGASPRA